MSFIMNMKLFFFSTIFLSATEATTEAAERELGRTPTLFLIIDIKNAEIQIHIKC